MRKAIGAVLGVVLVFGLAWLAWQGSIWAGKSFGDFGKALEFPLWAALLGLVANLALTKAGLKAAIGPGIKTELWLKTGLVLLGTTVSLGAIVKAGAGGIVQGIFMVTCVFLFSWWLGGVFGLNNRMRAVMSCAVSICGVSAAIAAAGAVLAKKEELGYVVALVIVTALPLMVIMPWLAGAMNLAPVVAGAWFGGNIDTTAAVVGAGTLYGPKAAETASIVKMSQNALIGVVAFLLALNAAGSGQKPSARVIWDRFPKFVLGFIGACLLVSLVTFPADGLAALANLKNWAFCMAFVGIGIDLDPSQLRTAGNKPTQCYLITTMFNTCLALVAALVIFGIWLG